ncbi:hypothetical protein [Paraflavitalea speifideaquila]|uniref:hypothetical protein n=1 Tax=Paraflavitalea speifideaquila TaxID=3076558 RepID=UPI0028ED0ACA|nr:hypothetical protein [Paraflavitalea speifideiaquila]
MKFLLSAALLGLALNSFAQTNTIGTTGNVGIGTTSLQSLLHFANYAFEKITKSLPCILLNRIRKYNR